MEVQTSARRFEPLLRNLERKMAAKEPYRARVALARKSAQYGYGVEDLMITFNIAERDARAIVFGRS